MEHIETVTVGAGGAASITFMSVGDIPSDYTDLLIVCSFRSTRSLIIDDIEIRFNDSTSNYSARVLYGDSGTTGSFTQTYGQAALATGNTATSNTFGNTQIYIPNYRSAAAKSYSATGVGENNGDSGEQITAGLWNVTDPITSINLRGRNGNLLQYSSATLYGIRKYNTTLAPKASGGIISYDAVNNKWVHVFTASGTFTPTENLSGVEYLVVAGGGAGGGAASGQVAHGGGGAGGYRSSVVGESSGGGASAESTLSLTASTNYTVTIGAGGSGASRTSGSNSVFGSITATGGGAGGASNTANALSGGSGGGSGHTNSAIGTGTANQGYNGGLGGTGSGGAGGGGGGGAAAVGQATISGHAGDGGNGVTSSITGSAIARGGGGGGGTYLTTIGIGGAGGGGNGGVDLGAAPTAGQANTGGGGGGSGSPSGGGNGGSGIVIVRYGA